MEIVDGNILPRRVLDSACVGSMLDFFDFLDVEEKGERPSCRYLGKVHSQRKDRSSIKERRFDVVLENFLRQVR